jgi:tetratricopeptide (TPR) repeat protein
MSAERIQQLHEQASERYLNGDYHGAIDAWREVLGMDPSDEQALSGVQMATQFVAPEPQAAVAAPAPAQAVAAADVERDLDRGLKVLDALGGGEMQDLVDGGAVDRKPASEPPAASEHEGLLEGWETSAPPSEDASAFGLEPVTRARSSAPAPSPETPPASAAAAELKRRVDDLLAEAKAKADAGERDEALAILARLGILDEDNAEAETLRATIEAAGASDLDKVENSIIEGVAALEANHLDDAEKHFQAALAISPEHREAKHYLEKVAERRSKGQEDLLSGLEGEAAPSEDAVSRATEAAATPSKPAPAPPPVAKPARATAPAPLEPPAAPARSGARLTLPGPKALVMGAAALLVILVAVFVVPKMLGAGKSALPNKPAAAKVAPAASGIKPSAGENGVAHRAAPPLTPEERARKLAADLGSGQALMAGGDFSGAVIAFNEALVLDPTNAVAKAGLAESGDKYKANKAEIDALNSIKLAFRDGEFTSGLRLAYRLPPTVSKSTVDGIKVTGWYNLAVVALRAGDCREAQGHLDEALQIAPGDDDAKKLRDFASSYKDAVKDRAFLDHVEALEFRSLPAS